MAEESWTAIVVTTQDHSSAQAFLKELEFHQKKGYIASSTLLLCVEDPRCKVGSGGATLNALLVVAEHLSAMSGHTVVTSDVLRGTRILLCHVGTHFPFSACQRGFTALPIEMHGRSPSSSRHTELPCIIDLYLDILTHLLAVNAPPGLWVCSTDRILCIPHDTVFSWDDSPDVRIFAVPKDVDKAAASNGACKISENGAVEDIIYNGTKEDIQKCQTSADGKVPTLSGVVYMNSTVAETLLSLHVRAPLEACTYIGLDSAVKPVKNLSLFYDILLAMATGVKENDFVAGRRSGEFSTRPLALDAVDKTNRKMARQLLWDALSGYTMKAVTIENGDFNYVYACARDLHEILHNFPYHNFMRKGNIIPKKHLNAAVHKGINEKEHTIINSIVEQAALGEETVILHSNIPERVVIGKRCLVSNLLPGDLKVQSAKFQVADELVIQALTIKMRSGNKDAVTGKQRVVLVWGLNDNLNMSIDDESSTFCNESWDKFHKRTEIAKSELWNPDMDGKKSLMNARIFPVYNPSEAVDFLDLLWLQGSFADQSRLLKWRSSWRLSIADIVSIYDSDAELSQRRLLLYDIGKKMTERILLEQSDRSLLPFFRFCTLEGFFEEILAVLDTIASQTTINQRAALSRTFACIADVIGARANGRGGLRSGPAANVAWQEGIELLKQDKVVEAIAFFSRERKSWFSRPDLLVRAARHYEGAFQVQVRKAVNTARQFIKLTSCDMVPIGKYVTAQAPARVDIAGTWSDTPPICYEHGGSVITAGVKIDSKKPIGCRVKRIPEPYVILILGRDENMMRIECKELEDLTNYHQVNSPGTLLKAAFFCANILSEDSDDSLQQQLLSKYNGGFILQTWSELPHGSGMGTSSILAGTILAALWKVIGKEPDVDAVVHAVLDLEQMMTTGGGWQDNVGGLAPGIKEGSSKRGLPLQVTSTPISMPDGFLQKFQKHLILIFSGKTRLARNMLQDVLRNWNARLPAIVKTADNLVENAKNCIRAFNKGDLEAIGHTMNTCWEHKKLMAPGCEPEICKIIMDSVRPVSYGQCLAGAGGGGFMYVITKNENAVEEIRSILSDLGEKGKKATVHAVEIDNEGLKIEIEQ